MAESVAPSDTKANFFRLSSLLLDGGKVALKSLFDHFVPPANLQAHLRAHNTILQKLKRSKKLKQSQEELLFPPPTNPAASSSTFDITLLIMLLRNVCGLRDYPQFDWNNPPAPNDLSVEADIVRLREYRNEVQHSPEMSIGQSEFDNDWSEIRDVILRLQKNVPNFEETIDRLKTDSIDPEREEYYRTVLREWEESDRRMKEDLERVNTRIDTAEDLLETHGRRLDEKDKEKVEIDEQLSAVRKCQEESHKDISERLDAFEQEMKNRVDPRLEALMSRSAVIIGFYISKKATFVETKAFDHAKKVYEKEPILVLIGNPGEGKSTIAVNLMLSHSKAERCLIIQEPDDWNTINWRANLFDAILIDDIFGMKKLQQNLLREWIFKLNTLVRVARMGTVQFIITTQPYILEECKSELADFDMFTSKDHAVYVKTLDLTENEMEEILKRHLLFRKKDVPVDLVRNCIQEHRGDSGPLQTAKSIPIGFPECASLFSTDSRLFDEGAHFFRSPKKFFKKVITQVSKEKTSLLSFFLIWASKTGSVTNYDIFDIQSKWLKEIANDLGLELSLPQTREVKDTLEKHTNGLIAHRGSDGSYSFSHNIIRDILGLVASEREPEATIKFASKHFFMEFIAVSSEGNDEDKFYVEPYLFANLAVRVLFLLNHKRVFYKISRIKGQLKEVSTTLDLSILWHNAFQNPKFVEAFFIQLSEMQELQRMAIIGSDVMKITQKLQPYGLDTHELKLNLIGATLLMDFNAETFVLGYLKHLHPHLQTGSVTGYLEASLLFAVDKGNVNVVRELLQSGARVTGNGLYMAAFNGRADILDLLLQLPNTDPNEKGQGVNGNNALIIASKKGHASAVKCLLKNKADPDVVNDSGKRAIEKALMHDNEEICQLLVNAGTSLTFKSGKLLRSALHIAADKGLNDVVTAMLQKGADLKKADKRGQCPIHIAAMQGRVDVVETLLKHDKTQAVLRAKTYGRKSEVKGMTAFHYAARKGFSEIVDQLLRFEVDPNLRNFFGQTPAYIAASFGKLDVLKSLKNTADMNLPEKQGFTPLHVAVFRNQTEIVKFLCSLPSINVNTPDKFGRTPLHVAAEKGLSDIARCLLSSNGIPADVRMLTKKGDTVYHRRRYKKVKQMAPVLQNADEKFARETRMNKSGMQACGMAFKNDCLTARQNNLVDQLLRQIVLGQETNAVGLPATTTTEEGQSPPDSLDDLFGDAGFGFESGNSEYDDHGDADFDYDDHDDDYFETFYNDYDDDY